MTDDVLTLVRMANTVPDLADLDAEEIRKSQVAIDEAIRVELTPGLAGMPVRQRRLRPILVAAVVAVVVALVIGIPALLSRSTEEAPIVDEPAPTTVVTTAAPPTTSVTTTAGPSATTQPPQTTASPPPTTVALPPIPDRVLTRVTDVESFAGVSIAKVIAGGPGFVAVGLTERWEGQTLIVDAAIWASADGVTWTPAGPTDVFRGTSDDEQAQWINDVVVHSGTLVAVGVDGYEAAAWTSSDGITWARATDASALAGSDVQEIVAVAAGGPGLVAVGRNGSTVGIWVSPDGDSWTLVEAESFGSYSEPAVAFDVAGLPSGLVVVGSGGFDSDRWGLGFGDLPAVWTSEDGLSWNLLPIDTFGDPETFFFESVETTPTAFLLDSNRDDQLQQWASPDGGSWTATSWASCWSEDPRAIVYAAYPGAECIGLGSLDTEGLDGAEIEYVIVEEARIVVVGNVLADGLRAQAIWSGSLDD